MYVTEDTDISHCSKTYSWIYNNTAEQNFLYVPYDKHETAVKQENIDKQSSSCIALTLLIYCYIVSVQITL